MEDCCNCLSLKKQLEDLKQKHLLDFRTIKQKIISTDTLIRSYQEKCQEYDKQKKYVVDLTSKLDGAQRSVEVIKLQLKKSLELVEPLQKKCNELEREKVFQCGEIQALQDRLRGSENLVGQLQSVIKESEVSANSMRLDATLHTGVIEEYKKSQKKNEAQISKLSEQVLTEKKTNKALNRELTKSQNQKLIAALQEQLNTGQNDHCEQQTNTSLEKQIMTLKTEAEEYKEIIKELKEEVCKAKQPNTDKHKIPAENKIKSPTTPRRSPRNRKSVTPKQEQESLAIIEQRKPLTRLQQKNLIEEIEKKSLQVKSTESISPSQQENLTSESESDADETGTLLDKVNEILDMPYCPSLSPLPPSPFLDGSSVGEFGNNDPDYICDDNGIDDNAIDNGNHDLQNYIGDKDDPVNSDDKNYPNDGNDNISKDNFGDIDNLNKGDHDNILQTENLEDSRGKKRELGESTTPEFGETLMTLRSRKRLKSGNSDSDSGPFSKEKDEHEVRKSQTLKRTKSVEMQELNTPEVNVPVTSSKSVEETTEGVLEVKPRRRRRKRRLSSNDESHEQSFESSDTSTVENNVLETSKQSSDTSNAENKVVNTRKHSEGSSEGESNKKTKENDTLQKIPRRPRTRSMDKFVKQDVVDEEVSSKDETSSGAKVPTVKNQTNSETLIQGRDSIMESTKRLQTNSMDELGEPDVVAEGAVSEKSTKAKVPATEDQSNNETLTSTETPIRPQTRSTHALCEQDAATEGTNSKEEEDSSDVKAPPTENGTNIETVAHEALDNKCSEKNVPVFEENLSAAETNHRETDEVLKCLQDIIDIVANETSGKISTTDVSKELIDIESCTDSQDGQKEVMDCLNVVTDEVVKSDNNSSTLQAEIDFIKPLTRHNSKVVKDDDKNSSTSQCETNDINDNHVKSGKCDVKINNTGSKSINVANTENSGSKATDKTKLDDFSSSKSVEPVDRTSTGKTGKRPTCVRESVNESCNNIDDHNKENKTAKTNPEILDSVDHIKYDTTVSAEINQSIKSREINSKSSGNENVVHTRTRKHKTGTTSDCVSTSNEKDEREITRTDENDLSKSSFDGSEFLKPTSHDLVTNNTPKTQYEASKEAVSTSESEANVVSEKSTTHVSAEDPTILHGITSPTSPPRDSLDSLQEQLEQTTPLSPIPDTPPKRPGRSAEIPCFDSFDHLPLSPIPPSPPPRADEECISTNLTFDENVDQSPKDAQVDKQQKLNRNELPNDALRRYPGVNEPQYTVFILTKLKNKEITLEDLITAFSVLRNVKNHTPICNGVVTVLKLTQDEEHALMEKYAEHYERGSEGTGEPIVSEFEMQVLIAVKRLCNIQRHSSLLKKLVKWLGMNLCELFKSEKNDAGLLAMCRIYTGVCRLMGEGSYIRVLCYDILKQNKRHSVTERMILAMALVWPDVFGTHSLTIHPEAVTISGPPYYPFLATLQVILMSREMSCEQTKQWLQRLCGWCDIPRDNNVLEWLAKDLVRVLQVTNDATSEENPGCNSTVNNVAFETIKSLELLAIIMGWKWTNDILIRGILWPVFKEWMWKIQGFDAKQETILDSESQESEHVLNTKETQNSSEAGTINADGLGCSAPNAMSVGCQPNITNKVELECLNNDKLVATSNETVCSVNTKTELSSTVSNVDTQRKRDFKRDGNMDTTIANILHLLGVLGCERLRGGEMINLDAVINLMCAIVTSPGCEKASFSVQLAAASALLDMIKADPVKITQVLENWSNRGSKDTLTAQFARRMKEVRTHMWTTHVDNIV